MAALLHHQAAAPTAKPPHPWALHSTTSSLSPLSRRRRCASTIRSAATDSSFGTGGDAAPSKKTTRKEKQQERRRQQDLQDRQQQLLMMEEKASLAKRDGGTGSSSSNGEVDGDDDELPQPVFDRILRRIAFTVGLPMATGVALLNVYDALKRGQGVVVPSWVPLLTILVAFGTSALGIAYGTLSASWNPDREGSLLGIDEARANWPVLWQEEIQKEKEKKAKQMKK